MRPASGQQTATGPAPDEAREGGPTVPPAANANDGAARHRPHPRSRMPGPLRMSRDDQEFLPAALEILEQPASPVRIALIWFIAAVTLTALIWSWFGQIDIHAVAQGRIQPDGRTKVIQPLEPGRISAIHVVNGARVRAGDPLLDLDSTETGADREAIAAELDGAEAEAARRQAALASLIDDEPVARAISFAPGLRPALRQREQAALAADIQHLAATQISLRSQIEERRAQQRRIRQGIIEREKLVVVLTERVAMRQKLVDLAAGARAPVIDAIQELQKEAANLVSERGQMAEMDAAIASLEAKRAESRSQFRAEQTAKLVEAERRADKATQDAIKARSRDSRTRLIAPIDGTVQQLAVTTLGQVVTSGQPLLTLVPSQVQLEIEALVLNRDIGFVRPGQDVTIKVEAFPFTRFGTIEGKVLRVSDDAIDEREAATLADAAATTRSPNASALSPNARLQNLVFPATISLPQTAIPVGERLVPLSAGMSVTVEIKTGQRRVIDYVLSPIREVGSEAARER
jgi:hemolysin D